MTDKRFGLAIIGGSGYGAGELLRLASLHPDLQVCCVTSRSHAGKVVSAVHSHLTGIVDIAFSASLDPVALSDYERSAIVLAMPSGQAIPAIKGLLAKCLPTNTLIVDLSGDLRLTDSAVHGAFYKDVPFEAELRAKCIYGISELSADAIRKATYITNPGCLATASILALAPLGTLSDGKGQVVIDAKTGTSGAGREPQASMHHPMRANDFTAYKVLSHRHEPEIIQALGSSFLQNFSCMFAPHLLPLPRGIFVTAYISFDDSSAAAALPQRYASLYRNQPFIRLRGDTPPRLVDVIGTNFCDIGLVIRGSQVVVMCAIDNLGKGMAGQAIQNLNIAFGLPQETGLLVPALGPV